ncbi:MAG: glycosyltransferase [Xenococcaceae cyanobacterium MO_207.B15]|nr:glycosyltransferase [Xenococcaceae cyanobacterium MO_207.B15]
MSNYYKRAIVTICSSNCFPYARILFNSLQKYHPSASLFLCLADKFTPEIDLGIEGVEIIPAEKLSIRNFPDFAFRYDIMEFNSAVKPFVMQLLIEERGFEQVVYLDPDIELFAPITPVFEALNNGAHFVVTPHITQPAEGNEYPDDIGVMKAGIYNLGFIAVDNSIDTIEFLHWWGRKLRFQCINQQEQGIFVDQKFVDLLPAFHDNVAILRDTTLNVAYWNLTQRKLEKAETGWLADGKPLIFFHFSGIDPKNPHRLSKYTERFNGNLNSATQAIIDHYIAQLQKFGYGVEISPLYGYRSFSNGVTIADIIRRCYRDLIELWFDNPFDTFHHYLNQPSEFIPVPSRWLITNLMYYLWQYRQDLKQTFNPNNPNTHLDYVKWFIKNAEDYGIDSYFINPVLDNISQQTSFFVTHVVNSQPSKADVSVIGNLKAETGVGHAGRMVAKSLKASEIATQGYNITFNVIARQEENSLDELLSSTIDGKVHIYNQNADQLKFVREHLGKTAGNPNLTINMPFWELSKFPQAWVNHYQGINEIWAPSRFVQSALQNTLSIPVVWLPPAVTLDQFTSYPRSYFQLPDDAFLFHFNFDFSSYATRKNPTAAIEAYRRAFRHHSFSIPTALVIKTRGYDPEGKNLQKLIEFTQDEPDIYILNQEMTYSETMALMNCCDCYVSLHRSEGFGYTPAEAMLLQKPVIATDYSGTKDFINIETGFPVSYRLIPVKENEYPFWEGQKWAEPDLYHAAWLMRKIVTDEPETKAIAKLGQQKILNNYSCEYIGQLYKKRLQQIGIIK